MPTVTRWHSICCPRAGNPRSDLGSYREGGASRPPIVNERNRDITSFEQRTETNRNCVYNPPEDRAVGSTTPIKSPEISRSAAELRPRGILCAMGIFRQSSHRDEQRGTAQHSACRR